jgi:hypothetical protein
MIYVCVWRPMDLKLSNSNSFDRNYSTVGEFERYFGHTSLLVTLESGKQAYLSYWPDDPNTGFKSEFKTLLRSTIGMQGKFMDSYEKDEEGMRPSREDNYSHVLSSGRLKGEPDEIIKISSLNEQEVYSAINVLTKSPGTYNFFMRNCSTLVTSVLQYGSQNCKSDRIASAKSFASRAWEIFNTTAVVAGVLNGKLPTGAITSMQLSLTRPVFSLVEICGFRTPRSVEDYAKRLAQLK